MRLLVLRSLTAGLLVAVLVHSVVWCFDAQRPVMQPINALLLIAAAICGIPADRVTAAAEGRRQALRAMAHDLARSSILLGEARDLAARPKPGQIYPRLRLAALDAAVFMNALHKHRDQDILQRALDVQNMAFELNRRLEITEVRLCTAENIQRTEIDYLAASAVSPDGPFARTAAALTGLREAVDAALRPRAWWSRSATSGPA
ncbi:hypothetical protein ACFXK0_02035 [Nocardia sp. NPDC059177]|uniref:hypothetical protein n=1 Tax=Nocardia sp. NPDC059177 TaxID=3346759 RepID=UPI0036CBD03A